MKAGIDERQSERSCESRKEGWTDSSNRVSILVATDSHVERIAHAFGCNIVQVRRPVNRSRQIYPHLVIGLPWLETRRNLTHIRHTCLYTFIFFTLQFSHMSNVSQYPRTVHFISPSILLSISPETNIQRRAYALWLEDNSPMDSRIPLWSIFVRKRLSPSRRTYARFVEFSFVCSKKFVCTRV